MMFSKALGYLLAVAVSHTTCISRAEDLSTCEQQDACIFFRTFAVYDAPVYFGDDGPYYDHCPDNEECGAYRVCIAYRCGEVLDYACTGHKTCHAGGGLEGFVKEENTGGQGGGRCQTVPPGGKAEFLFKDGEAGCQGSASIATNLPECERNNGNCLQYPSPITCEPRPADVASCDPESVPGTECLWTVQVPDECPIKEGGMLGDPHIMRWNGKRISFHGECDLVMIHNEKFGGGKGLDLHIRTTINKFYSFIETMALRIGNDTLEIKSEEVYFNGKEQGLPSSISGYPIIEEEDGANKIIKIFLNNGDRIDVKIYKMFLNINVVALPTDFGNSVGLLGDFGTGAMLARDGKTLIELDDEFGAEWQVQEDEPKLFHDSRAPQLPEETCRMPSISAARGLRSNENNPDLKKAAEEACRNKSQGAFDFCVFDVMATGDIGMAGVW